VCLLQERVYHTKISDVDELKQRINSEWAALSRTVIEFECAVGVSVFVHAFVLGGHFEHTL